MRQASPKAVASFTYLSSLLSSLRTVFPRTILGLLASGLGKMVFLDHSIWILSRQEKKITS
eukprot:scaffold2442_cov135-Skeletonema_dohrnii-CCMP3373.AAC.1